MPVHPHACGEREYVPRSLVKVTGSSPRMWGTLVEDIQAEGEVRFIPTHVGNASKRENEVNEIMVHPHACGERE